MRCNDLAVDDGAKAALVDPRATRTPRNTYLREVVRWRARAGTMAVGKVSNFWTHTCFNVSSREDSL